MRPLPTNIEEVEPGWFCTGWQHEAASRLEWQHRERHLMPVLADSERALLRAQSGPAAGMSLSAVPSSPQTRIESQLFRVLLLRRLRLPLPLLRACADVAFSLTTLAIIVHLALRRGFWEGVDSQSRARRRASVMRHRGESPQTSSCATLTSLPSFGGAQLAPPWCPRCTAMGRPMEELQMSTVLFWLLQGDGRSARTQSWFGHVTEPGWWCWQAMLLGDGQRRQ